MKLSNIIIKQQIEKEAKKLKISIELVINKTIKIINIEASIKGKGKGTLLLNFIKSMADKTDKIVEFDVDSDNQKRLITFYKRLGFKLDTSHYEFDDDLNQYIISSEAMMSGKFYPLMTYNK